jgi:hypothetical protein
VRVGEGVSEVVPVGDAEGVPVGVLEALCEGVALPLSEAAGVGEAVAPAGSVEVGDAVTVLEPLRVAEGVGRGVPVLLPVAVAVGEPVPVSLGVALPLSETDPVFEGLAPAGSEAVGDDDMVELPLTVGDGVGGGVPVLLPVADAVGVTEAVELAVKLPLNEAEPELLADAPGVREAVGVADTVLLAISGDIVPVFAIELLERFLDEMKPPTTIIFARTKIGTQKLADDLKRRGHKVRALHGDMGQGARDSVMIAFRGKRILFWHTGGLPGLQAKETDLLGFVPPVERLRPP